MYSSIAVDHENAQPFYETPNTEACAIYKLTSAGIPEAHFIITSNRTHKISAATSDSMGYFATI